MNKAEINAFFKKEYPHYGKITVDEVGDCHAVVRHHIGRSELRHGGTVAGPVSMLLADVALYVAILGELGMHMQTATTSLNINFLRKPSAEKDLVAHSSLLKIGKRLVVGDVNIYSEGDPDLVAHAVGTYSIPVLHDN